MRLHPGPHTCAAGTHSRLADGRTVCWFAPRSPGARYAVDAELAEQPVTTALARRLPDQGRIDPWGWWTRAEVCAKLLDVPIIVWLARHGWPGPGTVPVPAGLGGREPSALEVATHRTEGIVLSVGCLRVRRGTPGPGA